MKDNGSHCVEMELRKDLTEELTCNLRSEGCRKASWGNILGRGLLFNTELLFKENHGVC